MKHMHIYFLIFCVPFYLRSLGFQTLFSVVIKQELPRHGRECHLQKHQTVECGSFFGKMHGF